MNKEKLASIKSKIKRCAPAAISIASTISTIATVIYYQQKTKDMIDLTEEDKKVLQTHNVNICYSIDGEDYALRHLGKTPDED
jgi:hypothetical protein